MDITITEENAIVVAKLSGRLDTAAATEKAEEFANLNGLADKQVVVDCTDLSYISSSGLRLFLSLRKASIAKGGSVVIKNITDEIRDVFAMTGFTSLFTIE